MLVKSSRLRSWSCLTNFTPLENMFRVIADYALMFRLSSSVTGAILVWRSSVRHELPLRAWAPAALAVLLAFAATFALNDATDSEVDQINTPWRPVARGSIPTRIAVGCAVVAYCLALLAVIWTGIFAQVFAFCIIVIASATYSFTWRYVASVKNLGVAILIASTSIVPLLGTDVIDTGDTMVFATVFLFMLQKEIVSDVRDLRGDTYNGRQTMVQLRPAMAASIVITSSVLLFIILTKFWNWNSSFILFVISLVLIGNSVVSTWAILCRHYRCARSYLYFANAVALVGVFAL